jgi:hypothetical protein
LLGWKSLGSPSKFWNLAEDNIHFPGYETSNREPIPKVADLGVQEVRKERVSSVVESCGKRECGWGREVASGSGLPQEIATLREDAPNRHRI